MKLRRTLIAALLVLLFGRPLLAKVTAFVGGTVHPVTSEPVENGTLVFDESRIIGLGKEVDIPEGAERIDCQGQHIYPSFVAAYSQIGLVEISAIRATDDRAEMGDFNPNASAHKAFNPDSELIPVTRSNGVLLALAAPIGGLFSGQSSLMKLSGWTWEEMLLKPQVAMHVSWPSARDDGSELKRITKLIEDARAYKSARDADADLTPFDVRWEAMQPMLAGKQPLMVEADELAQIQTAVAFAAEHKLRLILFGGYDAPRCAALLKAHDVPIVVSTIHRLPLRAGDPYDAAYTLPNRLREARVRYCIAGDSGSSTNLRNLPYHAATAAAYGLPADEALKAITLYPAQILEVADRIGSLEPGKAATVFIADGDPLESPTQITAAYIDGKPVDLNDRHKTLYERFKKRLE
jgi:imidazolonepropionase-like amidohydrolase